MMAALRNSGLPGRAIVAVAAPAFRLFNRRKVAVLAYHGVIADDEPLAERNWLQVRASEFRAQMDYLSRHYEVCGLDAVLTRPWSGRPRAVITFDDGYANNHGVALPILREYGLPATIFVATGAVGTGRLFWWDRLLLSCPAELYPSAAKIQAIKRLPALEVESAVDAYLDARGLRSVAGCPSCYRPLESREISELLDSGLIELGSHTHGHEILLTLSDEQLRVTLAESAASLRRWGANPRFFAAPNGDYRDEQIALIREQGFTACIGTQAGLWRDTAAIDRIPRLEIGRGTDLGTFATQVSGAMEQMKRMLGRGESASGY